MKITAKDLKVGMTVKYCNVWVLIQTLKETTFKNGKEKIEIIGTQLEGVIRRSNGVKQKVTRIENFDIDFKATTKVVVK